MDLLVTVAINQTEVQHVCPSRRLDHLRSDCERGMLSTAVWVCAFMCGCVWMCTYTLITPKLFVRREVFSFGPTPNQNREPNQANAVTQFTKAPTFCFEEESLVLWRGLHVALFDLWGCHRVVSSSKDTAQLSSLPPSLRFPKTHTRPSPLGYSFFPFCNPYPGFGNTAKFNSHYESLRNTTVIFN